MSSPISPVSLALSFFFAQVCFPCVALAQSRGTVGYNLEWGSSRQTYTYVFSGTVTCQGRPCEGAHVEVDFDSPAQGVVSESTQSESNGRYVVQLRVEGSAEETATWKLMARAGLCASDPIELEGRVILMQDQTTVVVERPLMIG